MKTRVISFRLSDADFELLSNAAQSQGVTAAVFVRDLVQESLRRGQPTSNNRPLENQDAVRLLGQLGVALLVGLSPEMDAVASRQFMEEEFHL